MKTQKRNRNKVRLLRELQENPLIERACKKVGIVRSTYYRWLNNDPDFKKASMNAQEVGRNKINDFVESKLIESISNGSVQGMKLWLTHNHSLYRTAQSRNWEDAVAALIEYDRMFNRAIKVLGVHEARRAFGVIDKDEIRRAASERADMKRTKKILK